MRLAAAFQPVTSTLEFRGLSKQTRVNRIKLDARSPNPDESSRLKFQTPETVAPTDARRLITLESYGVELWFYTKR